MKTTPSRNAFSNFHIFILRSQIFQTRSDAFLPHSDLMASESFNFYFHQNEIFWSREMRKKILMKFCERKVGKKSNFHELLDALLF